jgi:hypothetical protein
MVGTRAHLAERCRGDWLRVWAAQSAEELGGTAAVQLALNGLYGVASRERWCSIAQLLELCEVWCREHIWPDRKRL